MTTTYPDPTQLVPPPDPPKPGRGRKLAAMAAAGVLGIGLVSGGVGAVIGRSISASDTSSGQAAAVPTAQQVSSSTSSGGDVSSVAAAVLPSVVQINESTRSVQGIGSGVIISADGQILTNNHVIAAAARNGSITVTFNDGKTANATVLGTDPKTDLAVIKAQGVSGLTPVTFGDSSSVTVGQRVVAIGSPDGLQGTVTSGIVSALNRPVTIQGDGQVTPGGSTVSYDAIQTDAPINPGNSGGPLLNLQGQVIGINSAMASPSGQQSAGSVGLGFAIPGNQAHSIIQTLVNSGSSAG